MSSYPYPDGRIWWRFTQDSGTAAFVFRDFVQDMMVSCVVVRSPSMIPSLIAQLSGFRETFDHLSY